MYGKKGIKHVAYSAAMSVASSGMSQISMADIEMSQADAYPVTVRN